MPHQRFLSYGRQFLEEDDFQAVQAVLRGDYLTQGPMVEAFEEALAAYAGARYAVAVSSGTAALHIAAAASGIGSGEWGGTSGISFAASANAFQYVGGNVSFLDIDPYAVAFGGAEVEAYLVKRPECRALIPVHYGGLPWDAAAIRAAAGKRVIIEDAAHSIGAQYDDGRAVGCCAYSDMTVFSFHPIKSITTGEGGAVLTNDPSLYHALQKLRNHGMVRAAEDFEHREGAFSGEVANPWYYEQQDLGWNYRLSDLHAALGLNQIRKLDRFIARRREIAARYDEAFGGMKEKLALVQDRPSDRARSSHHLYVVRIDFEAIGVTRTDFMTALREKGIGTQVHYIPIYRHPFYQNIYGDQTAAHPLCEDHYVSALTLPIHLGLSDDDVDYIVENVVALVNGKGA